MFYYWVQSEDKVDKLKRAVRTNLALGLDPPLQYVKLY